MCDEAGAVAELLRNLGSQLSDAHVEVERRLAVLEVRLAALEVMLGPVVALGQMLTQFAGDLGQLGPVERARAASQMLRAVNGGS